MGKLMNRLKSVKTDKLIWTYLTPFLKHINFYPLKANDCAEAFEYLRPEILKAFRHPIRRSFLRSFQSRWEQTHNNFY